MEKRYKRHFEESEKLNEGNMAEFTIHADRNRDDTVTVYLSIHNHKVVESKVVDLHSDLYGKLFDYCQKVLSK